MLDHSACTDYPPESSFPLEPVFDTEQLIFGPLDMDDGRRHDPPSAFPWDATGALSIAPLHAHSVTASPASSASLLDFGTSVPSSDVSFTGLPVNHALHSNWAANSIVARDNSQERTSTPNHGHCRKRSTERDASYKSKFRLTNAPSPTHTTSSSDAGSRTSSVTRFFRRTVHRVRRSSSSLSGDTGSNTTRNDGQKKDNVDVKCKRVELRTVLDNLDERLKASNTLHREAVDLQTLYESGTVSIMRDFRASGIPRPLPQDNALFSEVDLVLAEIGRFYEELKKFWAGEIRHVVEALKKGRTDPRDFERWKNFHLSLKQTIESWKNRPLSGEAQPLSRDFIASSFTGVDLGAIALSLSSTIGSLGDALERMSSTASLQYSQSGQSYFQRVYVAFAGNRELCLSLLRSCADYGEKVLSWCFPFIASPTSSQVGVPYVTGLRKRATGLPSEETGSSAKSLETLEGIGCVGALLHGSGNHPTHGPSIGTGLPPKRHASPDPTRSFTVTVSHAMDKDPPKLDIMAPSPHAAGEPEGLQSTVSLGDSSGVGLPDAFQSSEGEYRTSFEDRGRNFGQDIFLRHSRECFLHLTWPALKDKALVLLSIYAIVSLAYGLF